MTVGFFGGKFLPIHQGHIDCIIKASGMCDKLYVGISICSKTDNSLFTGKLKPIPLEKRIEFVKQIVHQLPNVEVITFWQDNNSLLLKDWKIGSDIIKEKINNKIDFIFGSEPSYSEFFKTLYTDSEYIMLDINRNSFPISSTDIRQDGAFKHWEYIPNICKPYYNKKVAIVGTESTGKSSMVKKLALYYNTEYVEEYGRVMCERLNTGQPSSEYYPYIAYGHKMLEFEKLQKSNRVLFIDTESTVTQFYSQLYTHKTIPLLDEISKFNDYDLVIYLEPNVKWVDDGMRIHGNKSDRIENNFKLKSLFNKNGINLSVIDDISYNDRFLKIKKLVDNLFTD